MAHWLFWVIKTEQHVNKILQ